MLALLFFNKLGARSTGYAHLQNYVKDVPEPIVFGIAIAINFGI